MLFQRSIYRAAAIAKWHDALDELPTVSNPRERLVARILWVALLLVAAFVGFGSVELGLRVDNAVIRKVDPGTLEILVPLEPGQAARVAVGMAAWVPNPHGGDAPLEGTVVGIAEAPDDTSSASALVRAVAAGGRAEPAEGDTVQVGIALGAVPPWQALLGTGSR